MISNFNNTKNKKNEDLKFLLTVTFVFIFVAWLCTPPGNKLIQICFWGNNTKMFIAKLTGQDETKEYIFHRNNAVYLAKMYPKNRKRAISEIDKAIKLAPSYLPDKDMQNLYKDRANIYLFLGEHKKALDDFLRAGDVDFSDYLKMALLFEKVGNYKAAANYCNAILNQDSSAYAGYACLADVYNNIGKPEVSLRVWDLAIDRNTTPKAYIDRAQIKKSLGDIHGYNEDMLTAKKYFHNINTTTSLIDETLHPKVLTLGIV